MAKHFFHSIFPIPHTTYSTTAIREEEQWWDFSTPPRTPTLFLIFPGDISLHFPLTTEKTYTPPLGITLVPTEDGVFSSPGPGPICSTSEPFPANSSSLSSSVFSIVILLFRRKSHHTSKHGTITTTTTGSVRLPFSQILNHKHKYGTIAIECDRFDGYQQKKGKH